MNELTTVIDVPIVVEDFDNSMNNTGTVYVLVNKNTYTIPVNQLDVNLTDHPRLKEVVEGYLQSTYNLSVDLMDYEVHVNPNIENNITIVPRASYGL